MFEVGPPIPDEEQALIEWYGLNYFVQAKPPNIDGSARSVKTQDEQNLLDNEHDDTLAADNGKKGLPAPTFQPSFKQLIY